jgi:hypothetical protein
MIAASGPRRSARGSMTDAENDEETTTPSDRRPRTVTRRARQR